MDIEDINERLYNTNVDLKSEFNEKEHKYIVYHKGFYFMSIPYNEFHEKTFEHIRKTIWINENTNILDGIDSWNDKYLKSIDLKIEEIENEASKDIVRFLKKNLL